MKKISVLTFFLAVSLNIFSQTTFGIKTGLNLCIVKYANSDINNIMKSHRKLKPGINAGFFINIELAKVISVQTEILYTQKGLKYIQEGYSKGKNTMNYIEVPVLGQYNIKINRQSKFNIYVGGYVALWTDGKYIRTSYDLYEKEKDKVDFSNEEYKYNRIDAGYLGGVSIKINRFVIDLRYTHSVISSSQAVADGKLNRVFSLCIAYILKK